MRKDLNLNLSAVHENIRSRAYSQRFRNWFRVKASGSIGPMCFKSGAVACAPPIVRDESSRVFLGGALQQSPPLRRPSSMVGQFSLEVNRKDEPAVRRRPPPSSSKPAEMRPFYSGTDTLLLKRGTIICFAGLMCQRSRPKMRFAIGTIIAIQALGDLVNVVLGRIVEDGIGTAIAGALLYYLLGIPCALPLGARIAVVHARRYVDTGTAPAVPGASTRLKQKAYLGSVGRLRRSSEILQHCRSRPKWLQLFLAQRACTTLDDPSAALSENSMEQRVGCSDCDVSQRTQETQAYRNIRPGIQPYLLES